MINVTFSAFAFSHQLDDHIAGREFKSQHFYIVISREALIRSLGTAVCIPVSSGAQASRSGGVTVPLDGGSTDTEIVTGVAMCYQLRSLDLAERGATYVGKVDPVIMNNILSLVVDLIDPQI